MNTKLLEIDMKTYNLKDQEQYQEFFDMVVKDIDITNPVDGLKFPLNEYDEPINTDWLWENYGQYLDGTQTGLGYQVFNEIIAYYEPISEERIKEIKAMAESDWLDDYKIGQVKLIDTNEVEVYGLNDKELEIYVDAYNSMVNE